MKKSVQPGSLFKYKAVDSFYMIIAINESGIDAIDLNNHKIVNIAIDIHKEFFTSNYHTKMVLQ